jgi:hypothetical protein
MVEQNAGFDSSKNLLWLRIKEGFIVDDERCPVSGKRKYATEGEALATAAHQIATANAPKELQAYLCSWCQAWHLTKGAGSGGTRKRQRAPR